jgi:hypothetical protein
MDALKGALCFLFLITFLSKRNLKNKKIKRPEGEQDKEKKEKKKKHKLKLR